jgi:hypothetical protein
MESQLADQNMISSPVTSLADSGVTVRIPIASVADGVELAGAVVGPVIEGVSGGGSAPLPSSVTQRWTSRSGRWRLYRLDMSVLLILTTA